MCSLFFFFNDTATTEIYTLSLHDALPICLRVEHARHRGHRPGGHERQRRAGPGRRADRKSTRLNSSHQIISYAVFCLKKKKTRRAPRLATAASDDEMNNHMLRCALTLICT